MSWMRLASRRRGLLAPGYMTRYSSLVKHPGVSCRSSEKRHVIPHNSMTQHHLAARNRLSPPRPAIVEWKPDEVLVWPAHPGHTPLLGVSDMASVMLKRLSESGWPCTGAAGQPDRGGAAGGGVHLRQHGGLPEADGGDPAERDVLWVPGGPRQLCGAEHAGTHAGPLLRPQRVCVRPCFWCRVRVILSTDKGYDAVQSSMYVQYDHHAPHVVPEWGLGSHQLSCVTPLPC